ncbi:hypothetical protein TELCIR_09141 [Teladorsagia circumcincta]|uniref:Cysteine/serine-rich nuclear protein N-terminal domain-containing protein n=1 Tax=Teladorsagia circumcincta TaxID=45464 RepID=A0A2G9UFM9_TELCI|nr:hypothetical protein TELCIR_09141 [Teladorsagia circumcincta]
MVDKHFTKRQFPLWFGRRPELTLTHDGEDDGMESLESIRKSRLLCGCQCENGICNPETCQCAAEGIVCQVDGVDEFGSSHPCSCTSANCRNPEGRIEFDVLNVKNHCRMTILRTKHAEQSMLLMFFQGLYDSPQRIRFNSEGEPQSAAQMCVLPNKNAAVQQVQQEISSTMDDPPTRKFPVTPVYKRSKQKRGLRVELAVGADPVEVDKVKFPSLLKDSPEEA